MVEALSSLGSLPSSVFQSMNLDGLRAPAGQESPKAKDARLWKVAESFESILMRQMLSTMRQADLGGDLLMSSHSSKMVREMYDDQVADKVAEGDRNGLAKVIHDELVRLEQNDRDKAEAAATSQSEGARPEGIRLDKVQEKAAAIPLQPKSDRGLPIQTPGPLALPPRVREAIPITMPKREVKEPSNTVENSE